MMVGSCYVISAVCPGANPEGGCGGYCMAWRREIGFLKNPIFQNMNPNADQRADALFKRLQRRLENGGGNNRGGGSTPSEDCGASLSSTSAAISMQGEVVGGTSVLNNGDEEEVRAFAYRRSSVTKV